MTVISLEKMERYRGWCSLKGHSDKGPLSSVFRLQLETTGEGTGAGWAESSAWHGFMQVEVQPGRSG